MTVNNLIHHTEARSCLPSSSWSVLQSEGNAYSLKAPWSRCKVKTARIISETSSFCYSGDLLRNNEKTSLFAFFLVKALCQESIWSLSKGFSSSSLRYSCHRRCLWDQSSFVSGTDTIRIGCEVRGSETRHPWHAMDMYTEPQIETVGSLCF